MSLSNEDRKRLESALSEALPIKIAVVAQLYVCKDSRWHFVRLGALALVVDEIKKSYAFEMMDLKTGNIVFNQYFYEKFLYEQSTTFFHTFETDECVAGFSFADETEAKSFYGQVYYCKTNPVRSKEEKQKLKQEGKKREAEKKKKLEKKKSKKKKKKGSKSFFAKLRLFERFSRGSKDPQEEIVFSSPTNFRHASHVGWDSDNGFEIRNIPEQWRKLFQQAGVKKKDLRNPETAAYMLGVISEAMQENSEAPERPAHRAPPTPPPLEGLGHPEGPPTVPPSGGVAPPPPPLVPPQSPKMESKESGRGGLLSEIRQGKTLKAVDTSPESLKGLPSLGNIGSDKAKSLADTLASAMNARRMDLEDSEGEDEEWSDQEWSA